MKQKIILASQSPRRIERMIQYGYEVEVCPANIDEDLSKMTDLVEASLLFAVDKAKFVSAQKQGVVLAMDTLVGINGKILGKPKDFKEADAMFRLLCNNTHEVVTAVCLTDGDRLITGAEISKVTFGAYDKELIHKYINDGKSYDKAGGYGAQDFFGSLVRGIDGEIDNVIGFPSKLVKRMLSDFLGA